MKNKFPWHAHRDMCLHLLRRISKECISLFRKHCCPHSGPLQGPSYQSAFGWLEGTALWNKVITSFESAIVWHECLRISMAQQHSKITVYLSEESSFAS